jgi:hypothetical protein
VLVIYDKCRSTSGERIMAVTQVDISSMISFIKLVEINPCLWNFTFKSYSRTDLNCLGSSYRIHEISLRVETVIGRPLPNCV